MIAERLLMGLLLAGIAIGLSKDLLQRSAEVSLKERRTTVVVPRSTVRLPMSSCSSASGMTSSRATAASARVPVPKREDVSAGGIPGAVPVVTFRPASLHQPSRAS